MLVKNWMSKPVITINADATIKDAAVLLKNHKIRMLPVMEYDQLVGVIADWDLKRADAAQMANRYIREWEPRRRKIREKESAPVDIPPAICISCKIGVGALEIADILAEKINFRVVARTNAEKFESLFVTKKPV